MSLPQFYVFGVLQMINHLLNLKFKFGFGSSCCQLKNNTGKKLRSNQSQTALISKFMWDNHEEEEVSDLQIKNTINHLYY